MQGFSFIVENQSFIFNPQAGISLAIPVSSESPEAYGLGKPEFEPFAVPGFYASIEMGGSLNCEKISFYPHGCGTHTESLRHVDNSGLMMHQLQIDSFVIAQVVSVNPEIINGDLVVKALPELNSQFKPQAIIYRTLPNTSRKLRLNYSGTNPPYFSPEIMDYLQKQGIKHFLTDLPSVDREEDGGKLAAHKAFFNQRLDATITELIFVPDELEDGIYLLNLQFPKIATDAVPSNPIVFKLQHS
jgi:arylformamidase